MRRVQPASASTDTMASIIRDFSLIGFALPPTSTSLLSGGGGSSSLVTAADAVGLGFLAEENGGVKEEDGLLRETIRR